jgi:cyclic pyranopterin phosphate synthase
MSAIFGEPAARDEFSQSSAPADLGRRESPTTSTEGGTESLRAGSTGLTHVDTSGRASMVDVSQKAETSRVAVASARILLGRTAFDLVAKNQIAKGDVLTVAQIAGINAAKQTANLIPLCHNLLLSRVKVELRLDTEGQSVKIRAEVKTKGPTGVEMEALTAASVASLTVYDMCKAVSKSIIISDIRLESKSGGKSGEWSRHHHSDK